MATKKAVPAVKKIEEAKKPLVITAKWILSQDVCSSYHMVMFYEVFPEGQVELTRENLIKASDGGLHLAWFAAKLKGLVQSKPVAKKTLILNNLYESLQVEKTAAEDYLKELNAVLSEVDAESRSSGRTKESQLSSWEDRLDKKTRNILNTDENFETLFERTREIADPDYRDTWSDDEENKSSKWHIDQILRMAEHITQADLDKAMRAGIKELTDQGDWS